MRPVAVVIAIIVALLLIGFMVWLLFYRKTITFGELITKIINWLLTPFRLLLKVFGYGGKTSAPVTPITPGLPDVDIIKHELGTCPPCELKCPDPLPQVDCKPLELEISYLKKMVKFTGAMAKRENAINAQYKELYPGFSVMSPQVRKLSYEYNYLKNQLREDDNEWTYFKNYFTKLSGIPSTSSAIHYDLMM